MKLFLTGGFLGSGKTTAILHGSRELMEKGARVGVITNDQGNQLVDTEYLKGFNIPVMEVSDGCFCCNYDAFSQKIEMLRQDLHPEFIFAEAVGSCTDMIATVVKPFSKFNPEIEVVVSVFADARTFPSLIQGSRIFVNNVSYIYRKQLEESDILVINKIDLIDKDSVEELKKFAGQRYPDKTILFQNSCDKDDIQQWLKVLHHYKPVDRPSLAIDYDAYGSGEAELGWVDAELEIVTADESADKAAMALIRKVHASINRHGFAIGHLKFLVDNGRQKRKISFTAGDEEGYYTIADDFRSAKVNLLVNARIEADPSSLQDIVSSAMDETGREISGEIIKKKFSAFKPGYPKPTHRLE